MQLHWARSAPRYGINVRSSILSRPLRPIDTNRPAPRHHAVERPVNARGEWYVIARILGGRYDAAVLCALAVETLEMATIMRQHSAA